MVNLPACVGQDSPLTLPYSRIACKGTSPINELLFYVRQDSPLKLPYGHIAYKGTSPLHELLFYVGKVAPLNLPYGHILQGYLTPCSFVLGKLPFEVALCSHCLQRKFTPSWTSSVCWLKLLLDLTLWSHSVDFNPLFLCTSSWCCFNFSFVNICFSQIVAIMLQKFILCVLINIHISWQTYYCCFWRNPVEVLKY